MINNTDRAQLDRQYITYLSDQINPKYQQIAPERARLHQEEWDQDVDDTVLGVVESCTDDVAGMASQIAYKGYVNEPEQMLADMGYRFFDFRHCVAWYLSPDNDFPGLKGYIQHIDYLRLLVQEYIQTHQRNT
ncbi:MAG: hypothetical protein AAGF95_34370 [Chloroflexota bacterium]